MQSNPQARKADLDRNAGWAQKAYDDAYALPSPPSSPILHVYPEHQEVVLRWSADPETEIDPASKLVDFQGYRVFMSETPLLSDFRIVKQFDVRDGIGFDTGLGEVLLDDPYVTDDGDASLV